MKSDASLEGMPVRGIDGQAPTGAQEELLARLARQEQALLVLRARDEAYRKLAGKEGGGSFVFDLPVRADAGSLSVGEPDERTASILPVERFREKAALAVERGRPVWYTEGQGRGSWRVHLAPVSDGEGRIVALVGRAVSGKGTRSAVQRVRKADRLVQNLVELLPDAVMVTNYAGQVIHINSAGLQLLGATSPEDIIGRSVWDTLHPEDRARARERARRVQRGEQAGLEEHRLIRADGSNVPVETLSVAIRFGGRPALLSTARDISSRKQLEEELSESRELFYKAFKASPVGYVITRMSDGLIVDVNDEYASLAGYSREELVGCSTVELGLLPDPEARRDVLRNVEANGSIHQRIYDIRRKDGAVRRFLTSVQRVEVEDEICLISVVVDVTDREAAALAERESRDLLYRVFHASPAAIGIVRLSDGHYIDVNQQWSNLTGYASDEVVGNTRQEIGLWPDLAHREQIEPQGVTPGLLHDAEAELQPKTGGLRTVLVSTQNLQVKGEPSQLVVLTDITERKQVETELVRQKERAEQMSQLKTAFLTNMTHEVRTPLTVILGFTSMLRQGVREEYQRFVRVIERSGRRLLLMLDSILDLAQLEAGALTVERQFFNVGDVVRSEADMFRPIAEEKGLRFDVFIPEERAQACADHKIFVRVLNNLFDNAVKFTEQGSITLRVDLDDKRVLVSVEDTGLGMDEAFLPRMFDEFAQESTGLERTHQGSGLGLSVSKRLMELMDGSIDVQSKKGEGSRFTVYIPRAKGRKP